MRLSFSESIAFFLLLSPFGGISANDDEYNVHKDCSSFTWTFNTEKDTHFHMPTECPHHMVSEEEKAVCDPPDQFPMKCTFHLIDHSNEYEENDGQRRMVADMDGFNHTSHLKELSNESELLSRSTRKLKSTSRHGDQFEWASNSYIKLMSAQDINKCTPKSSTRAYKWVECSINWSTLKSSCGCDHGWEEDWPFCKAPCGGETSVSVGAYCFEDCRATIELHTNCGWVPGERTCVRNDQQCFNKYFNHAINIMDVAVFFSGAGSVKVMKKAVSGALRIAQISARKAALKTALKSLAIDMRKKLMNHAQIKKELSRYNKGVGERILEQGAVLLLASNLKDIADASQDTKSVVTEIAKAVDPTGLASLVTGFIPADSCDSVKFKTPMPTTKYHLIDRDVLDVLEMKYELVGNTAGACAGTYTMSNDVVWGRNIWDREDGIRFIFWCASHRMWAITASPWRQAFIDNPTHCGAFVHSKDGPDNWFDAYWYNSGAFVRGRSA